MKLHLQVASCLWLLIAFPLCGQAQGLQALLRPGTRAVTRGATMRAVPGKILPGGGRLAGHIQMNQMRQLIERQVIRQSFSKLPYVNSHISSVGAVSGFRLYNQVLDDFETLRTELNPVLFYQSNPQEARTLLPEEKRQWVKKIQALRYELARVGVFVQLSEPALAAVQAYLKNALTVLVPEYIELPPQRPTSRTDRSFQEEEFLLQNPHISLWQTVRRLSSNSFVFNTIKLHK